MTVFANVVPAGYPVLVGPAQPHAARLFQTADVAQLPVGAVADWVGVGVGVGVLVAVLVGVGVGVGTNDGVTVGLGVGVTHVGLGTMLLVGVGTAVTEAVGLTGSLKVGLGVVPVADAVRVGDDVGLGVRVAERECRRPLSGRLELEPAR